ncbi:toxin-antitoxin system YwqK family antitoxin [Christiangramia salexigens]|uniref:Aspartic peptidase n=1 Tax=Christiangramia salexigens TaxID=1913577 RepID=A0A1L3J4A1_9FLAO|nr:aspartic peptidase [Christiangramia salexigens]APG59936.1 aspartic peptidase [Christiangramia salexigens]
MIKHFEILTLCLLFSITSIAQKNKFDENGERHGYWKVDFEGAGTPKFEGNFEHGNETGTFKFYKKGFYDHPAAIMNFSKTTDSVHVVYYTQTGKPISEGKMCDKKREGNWVYYHKDSDSIMMRETYKNDTLHGLQKTYFPNGKLAEKTIYQRGEKNGESFIYADNGQVTKELHYKNGMLHGPAVYFTVKGVKSIEGFYTEGKKSGTWKYFSDGKLEEEIEY